MYVLGRHEGRGEGEGGGHAVNLQLMHSSQATQVYSLTFTKQQVSYRAKLLHEEIS